ncbi:PIG-L family deacetylase [Candidatus Accumulibacter phosphatis]|uniref:PIG-L family deacetylase n=1 Tax=Candidatus Accumulibacter contiguus TaxID=2954381 RepID=A0ABX1TBR7_9PROT|nr:PIG-L deacetylase family protein [Candidatus Accumulibacter contiguus]NMQ05966.1 PIG-L family deacetylase [Candidatus Accumulibacter contiguus]
MGGGVGGEGVRSVLVVAAHPDDEVLGCGGTIARHLAQGDHVHVLILAEGATSRSEQRDRTAAGEQLLVLSAAAREAHARLGSTSLAMLDFPDNRMDSVHLLDVVKAVESHFRKADPDIIYTHFPGDLNIDHRITSEAVQTACRPQPGNRLCQVLFFEVPSSTEWRMSGNNGFVPNYFCDISSMLDRKLAALDSYALEMRGWPHARSVTACEHLARWRGASIGVEAAEAFVVGRMLDALFMARHL